jgi:hypothetical protein
MRLKTWLADRTAPASRVGPSRYQMALGFGLILALGAFSASPAQAHCDKDVTAMLKFAMADVPAGFDAWNAAAEQFCPNTFITRDVPATDSEKEVWSIKFDRTYPGTDEGEAALWIIKTLSPMLKLDGYPGKPSGGEGGMGILINWIAPSKPQIRVEVVQHDETDTDEEAKKTLYEVEVWHHVN